MTEPTYLGGILQVKAYRALQACVSGELDKYDLTPTEWFIIGQISRDKGVRTTDLADQLSAQAPLITVLTDGLVKKKLIKKSVDPADRRARVLKLTAAGASTTKSVEAGLNNLLKILLDGLSDKEIESYKKVLETIVRNSSDLKNS